MIEIKNITVYQGDNRVFHHLSLEIPRRCQTAIIGPNGAGKSTFLKLLSCQIYPDVGTGGSIRIFGEERWNVWELRRRLGIVSHDLHHDYQASARGLEVILSGFYSSIGTYGHQKFTKTEMKKAVETMEQLEISSLKDRLFADLSAGEQRRFLLGRALVHDPNTLILDEPTSGLDLHGCFQYLSIIRRMIREGKTILLVTHHIHEIPPEISRVIFFKNGKIVADGDKQDLLTSEHLSKLFNTPVQILSKNGFYQAVPG